MQTNLVSVLVGKEYVYLDLAPYNPGAPILADKTARSRIQCPTSVNRELALRLAAVKLAAVADVITCEEMGYVCKKLHFRQLPAKTRKRAITNFINAVLCAWFGKVRQ